MVLPAVRARMVNQIVSERPALLEPVRRLVRSGRARRCPVIWGTNESPFRIWKWCWSIRNVTSWLYAALFLDLREPWFWSRAPENNGF